MKKRINKYLFTFVGALLFGGIGADRFMRGQVGIGILKLITVGGVSIWSFIDFIIALVKLGSYKEDFVFAGGKWAAALANEYNKNDDAFFAQSISAQTGRPRAEQDSALYTAVIKTLIKASADTQSDTVEVLNVGDAVYLQKMGNNPRWFYGANAFSGIKGWCFMAHFKKD